MKFTKTQFCFAWICFWISFGLLLDSFMGMKQLFYLSNPIRREMWRLAHAHGTLLTLVFLTYGHFRGFAKKQHENMMFIGMLLMPVGFFLGGIVTTEIDPFVGVFLVPVGGLLFVLGLLLSLFTTPQTPQPSPPPQKSQQKKK
jgi:hypothetical protein